MLLTKLIENENEKHYLYKYEIDNFIRLLPTCE